MLSFRRRLQDSPVQLTDHVDVNVLAPGDVVGEGLLLKGRPLSLVANSQPAPECFKVLAHQGKGSYAVVYQAQELSDVHRKFAIKCLSKHNLDDEARAIQMTEVTIHQSLSLHPNIVTLYRTLQTPDYLLLVLEFVEGEDLFYFLEQSKDHYDDDPSSSYSSTPPTPSLLSASHPSSLLSYTRLRLIASMFAQMCDAVAACHDQNVFHRDIKPENFIVTEELVSSSAGADRKVRVKLSDFGLSTREVECNDMDCGSAPYMSYECRNNIAPTYRPRAADVWSLGIVLINMLYHINPWTDTAHGACPSFETFRFTPSHVKYQFFIDRFPGMTRPVAEMLANRVFCILDDPRDDSARIEARELGQWIRSLPNLLGGDEDTGAVLSATPASTVAPLSLAPRHHRRTTSTSTSCSSPVIQGHRLSHSMRISHRPTSRPPSVYSSNRNSIIVGSPALGVRPLALSRAPSLEPAFEREEIGLSVSPSKERLDESELNGIPNGDVTKPPSRRRRRGARSRGKGPAATQLNSQGTQTPLLASADDSTLDTLAAASQSLAREISSTSKLGPPPLAVPGGTVNGVPGHVGSSSGLGSGPSVDESELQATSVQRVPLKTLSMFTNKFGGEKERMASSSIASSSTSISATPTKHSTSTKESGSTKVSSSSRMLEPVDGLPFMDGSRRSGEEATHTSSSLQVPAQVTRKTSMWNLLKKGSSTVVSSAAVASSSTLLNDTNGSETSSTAVSVNGAVATTTILASLEPPSTLRTSPSSTSLTPSTPSGSIRSRLTTSAQKMSTANNVTTLLNDLNPHSHHPIGSNYQRIHGNESNASVASGSSAQERLRARRRRKSRERDAVPAAVDFGTGAMGSFGTNSTVTSFRPGGQRSALASTSTRAPPVSFGYPGRQNQNPNQERMITPTSLRGGGGAFTFGHNNGRHHTSLVHPPSSAFSLSGSSSSASWRNSMSTMASTNSGANSSAAASMSSPGGSMTAFTRHSNSSTRSVSTVATSVSDVSWRTGTKVGGGSGSGGGNGSAAPVGSSNSNPNVNQYPNIPKNIKMIDGIPVELTQLPRGQGGGDLFPNPRKPRTRNKKGKQDSVNANVNLNGVGSASTVSTVTAGPSGGSGGNPGPLDTINERPAGSGEKKDASTSTTDLVAREDDISSQMANGSSTHGGTMKKVHKGQIHTLAKMLSALRR